MNDLTDFTNTDDVSDAAIEWVAKVIGDEDTAQVNRSYAKRDNGAAQAIIIAARLIQAHRPELIVDPVDAVLLDELRRSGWGASADVKSEAFAMSKRLYKMGLEAGKASK